jgi:hypothetical protein
VLRRITNLALILTLLAAVTVLNTTTARAQDKNSYTAEQIVETTISIYGSRPGLAQIRRNGWERGKTTTVTDEGRTEESTYERRFVRGENFEKDKVRVDQKTPTQEYALVYTDGKTFGLLKESAFTPREEAATDFLSQMWHGIDALLRYKENGSTIALYGKDKQQNIDLYIIDLVDKEKRKTRYFISQKYFRVLWLEYEEPVSPGGKLVKYMRKFYDYQYIQSTLLAKRTVFFEDGKQTQETRVLSVTYGIKMDDTLFKNPAAQASSTTP